MALKPKSHWYSVRHWIGSPPKFRRLKTTPDIYLKRNRNLPLQFYNAFLPDWTETIMTSFLSIKHFLYLFLEHQHPPPTINLSLRGFNLAVSSVFNEKKKKHFQGSNLSSSQSPWGEPPPTVRDMKLNCADGRCQNPVWQSRMGSPCSCVISPGLISLCQTHISSLALRYQAAFGRSNVSCCFHWDAAPEVVQFPLTHTLWGEGCYLTRTLR